MIEPSEKQDSSTALPDFGGVYVKLALICERQMTCAFTAEDSRTGQLVFIKILRESKVGDETAERLFANETGLLQFISRRSPSVPIVPLTDAGVCGNRPYFVQPLLSGFTLRSALRVHPVLAPQSALKLIEGCLEFLAALHTVGVAHGDVSPDNIFIETDAVISNNGRLPDEFRIRLLDYNSARRIDEPENKAARLVFLKLPYAAPELARGLPMSAQSDLYSLGVVLYEALTGARPYHVKTMSEVAELRENSIPAIPIEFDVPPQVEAFIRSLVSPDVRARPESVERALQSLREFKAVHRWLSQTETSKPAFYRRRESAEDSAGYEALLYSRDQPITVPRPVVDLPPRWTPPEPGSSQDVPTVTEAVEPVGSVGSSPDRAESSMAYAVPVPSREEEVSKVDFSVFAPASLSPGTSFILEVWAYLREQREQLLELANRDGRLVERGSRGPVLAEQGTELTLLLRLDGFIVADPRESFFWLGDIANVPFIVEAPVNLRPGVYPGQVSILHDGMLLTRLVFDVEVGKSVGETARLGVRRERISSAFASYASADREEVLRRVQGIMAAGVDVFLDVLSLRAGDAWEEQLVRNIREKDIFYLFWSVAASKSQWVEREWRCALTEKGLDYIQPIPLSDPREAPPPQELAGRHFNDLILAYLKSNSTSTN